MSRRLLTIVMAALALAACSDDDPTGPDDDDPGAPASLIGIYRLERVAGDSLPVLLRDDTLRVVLTSGYFNLNADETFTYGYAFQVTRNGTTTTETETGSGEWRRNNDAVIFFYEDQDVFPDAGTVSGRNLYLTVYPATPWVLRRE